MPRPGPRRRAVPLRLSEEEERPVRQLAERETDGNLSEMLRRLIAEALAERERLLIGAGLAVLEPNLPTPTSPDPNEEQP